MKEAYTLSLFSLVQGFIYSLTAESKSLATIHYYQGNLRRFLWYADTHNWPKDPRMIDTWKLREFLTYAGTARNRWGAIGNGSENCREPSRKGGWRYYRCLRYFFNWAVSEGYLKVNPIIKIKPKAPREQPIEPYSQEEMKKLIMVCDQDYSNGAAFLGARHKAVILLFVDTGMRLSELGNLKLEHISIETGRAVVTGKGNQQRVVAFSSTTKKCLWRYLSIREKIVHEEAREWLWITEEGKRLSVTGLHTAFIRIKKRSGVSSKGLVHKLRHTFALNALRGLKDPTLLQLLLGHKSLEMTRRYTQGLKIEEALAAIDKASPVERLQLS
jgi:site-specific recombinase XerD